jgi:hypothetical protein
MYLLIAGALAMIPLATGCGVDTDPEPDEDWTVEDGGDTAEPDVVPDTSDTGADPDVDPVERRPRTFKLTNATGGTLRVQMAENCRANPPGWFDLQTPDGVSNFREACGMCRCEDVEEGFCGTCDAACAIDSVEAVADGESLTFQWAGYVYTPDSVDNQMCQRRRIPDPSDSFTAEFCWSTEEGPTGRDHQLEETTCDTITFSYGDDRSVIERKVTDGGGQTNPRKTTFELVNTSGETLSIQKPNNCRQNGQPWVGLRAGAASSNSVTVDFGTDCTRCTCQQLAEGDACAVCAKACGPGPVTSLQKGKRATLEWDGVGYRRSSRNGRSCQQRWVPDKGEKLYARFCWSLDDPRAFTQIECKDVPFTYGEDETVRFEVDPSNPPEPQPTTIELHNERSSEIYVQQIDQCYPTPPGWLEMFQNQKPVTPATSCTTCSCSQIEQNGSCAVCNLACAAPTTQKVAPGGSVGWKWPGHTYEQETVDGMSCQRQTTPSVGETFQVELCWGPSAGMRNGGEYVNYPICETKTLTYGQQNTLVHRVTKP